MHKLENVSEIQRVDDRSDAEYEQDTFEPVPADESVVKD